MGNKNGKNEKRTALDVVRQIPIWSYRTIDKVTEEFLPKDPNWHEFTEIEQTVLEKAYQENQPKIDIDSYTIDLKRFLQTHKVATTRKWRIKREEEQEAILPIRYNRFHLHPSLEFSEYVKTTKSVTGRTLIMPFVWKWYQKGGGQESIGDGLLIEGKLAKHECEAKWMIEQITNSSYVDNQIRLTALSIFTLESFLYPLIQTTLRTNDVSKMSSLGPFLALLGDCRNYSTAIDRLLFSGIVYFSSNHDAYPIKIQLRKYLNRRDQFVKVNTFISATKNRSIAEQADDTNCLFIVHIKHRRNVNAIDVSALSRRPQEREILILPNVPFHVKKIECPKKNIHRHIVYLTVEN